MKPIRNILIAAIFLTQASPTFAGNLIEGCRVRPACGKVCKLVRETKTITVIAYGCECDAICVPKPSKKGCKYCCDCCPGSDCSDACCDSADKCAADACCDKGCSEGGSCCGKGCSGRGACCAQEPKGKFCWRKWCPRSCAKPRTVKKLTKYEVTKEICSYHWKVVDGCDCGDACDPGCGCVFKPAPDSAQIGAVLALSDEELHQVADGDDAIQQPATVQLTSAVSAD